MRRAALDTSIAILAFALGACADASGEVKGGEPKFDPTPPAAPEQKICPSKDEADAGSGATWTDLWRDYFGPTGAASCTDASCHGSPSGAGVRFGMLCVDQAGCQESLHAKGVILPSDADAPEESMFYKVLRRCDAQDQTLGTMPQRPSSYTFSPTSLARIATWLRNGAPND